MTKEDPRILLGKNLKHLREKNGLTTAKLASIMKISTISYNRMEQGDIPKNVTVDAIMYAAEHFDIQPAKFLIRTGGRPVAPCAIGRGRASGLHSPTNTA